MVRFDNDGQTVTTADLITKRHLQTVTTSKSHYPTIAPTVDFTVIAREMRCKWSTPESLTACQSVLAAHLSDLKADGRKVNRMVCGR
ncbi:hypothetical protein TL16_g09419 [Triparma laevis f. inornata]|uniref:Uncharacterized protein n=1 Tax=Triparma laevis f. inornata TaxID=1714386 RepID=A0A9W7BAL4_9STRA|nr:hypothetical protein TL16_g09419 [Triparma laevis f. inornata]